MVFSRGMSVVFQVAARPLISSYCMTRKVVNQILQRKTKMGTDATARRALAPQRPVASDAEILTSGRPRDCSLAYPWEAQTWNQTMTRNHRLYGKTLTATNIVRETGCPTND